MKDWMIMIVETDDTLNYSDKLLQRDKIPTFADCLTAFTNDLERYYKASFIVFEVAPFRAWMDRRFFTSNEDTKEPIPQGVMTVIKSPYQSVADIDIAATYPQPRIVTPNDLTVEGQQRLAGLSDYHRRTIELTFRYVNGERIHDDISDECNPDFSCCKPALFTVGNRSRLDSLNKLLDRHDIAPLSYDVLKPPAH